MPSSPDDLRPKATVIGAFVVGWQRVFRAPAVTLGVVAAMFALALPMGMALRGMLSEHLGNSAVAERAARGWDAGWAAEFDCASWGQFFLKFIVAHPAVSCVIPATSSPRHMADNAAAGHGRLPDQRMREKMAAYVAAL